MEFSLNTMDLVFIVGSLGIVVAVGMWVARKKKETSNDYFIASRKLSWWIIGTSVVATSVSSEQIVGTVGAAYEHGMGIANWEWFSLPTYTLVILFFVPVYIVNKITTVSEFYLKRFGPMCSNIYSWVMLVAYVLVFMVPVLYGGSLAFSMLTGFDFYFVLWLTVILVGMYTIKGGLLSVMWTDFLQCAFLVGGGLVLFLISLSYIPGGWSAMVQAAPERFHLYRPPGDKMAPFIGIILLAVNLGVFYQATNQVMIQRIFAAKSTRDGMLGMIFAGFINFIRPCVTVFLGFVVYHWINKMGNAEPLSKADEAFPFALKTFAPAWGLRGIVLAGFLAAIMSTISSLVNSIATIFALDVYKKIHPQAPDKTIIRSGQLVAALSLIIAGLMAPMIEHFGGIFKYFQTGVTYLATPFACIYIMGLFWKRTNYAGAIFGLVGGFIITILLVIGLNLADIELHWAYVGAIVQVLTILGIIIVSLMTAPPPESQWKPFLWRPSMLRQYNEGGKKTPWYKTITFWYAMYAAIWFYVYWRFW